MCVRRCRGQNRTFIVSLGRQANYPRLLATDYAEKIESILWLDDHSYGFGSFEFVICLCQLNVFGIEAGF